jgi:hypothetical protein
MHVEHIFQDMDIDCEAEAPHSSVEGRREVEPSSAYNSREVSHAIDINETGEYSNMNHMWRWPDFTANPLVFDKQQICTTPSTGNSSNLLQYS